MNLKKCRQILNAIALLVVIIVFASNIPLFNSIHKEMIYVSIFLIIIDIIFGFTFLRCPHCKKLLNFKWSSQSICHNCGARLDDDVPKSQPSKLYNILKQSIVWILFKRVFWRGGESHGYTTPIKGSCLIQLITHAKMEEFLCR